MNPTEQSLDEIMEDFRSNGKRGADFLELEDIELDHYSPEGRSLIRSLFSEKGLDSEMRIVRPPSRTPPHLPTSTANLLRKSQNRLAHLPIPMYPGRSFLDNLNGFQRPPQPWLCRELNVSMSQANFPHQPPSYVNVPLPVGQMMVLDQGSFVAPSATLNSRPIFGRGSTKKPALLLNQNPKCPPGFNDAQPQPSLSSIQPVESQPMTPQTPEPQRPSICPVAPKRKDGNEGRSSLDSDSEDELAESADSGIFTGGELSSPGSDLSIKSGESPIQSYASVVNTPVTVRSRSDGKANWNETLKAEVSQSQKKRFDSGSDTIKECVFCKTNGETPNMYRGHTLKDKQGRTVCSVLMRYVCPLCGATGPYAHTVKYCPLNYDAPAVAMMTTLKSMRSATGDIRIVSSTRRSHGIGKRYKKRTSTGASSYGAFFRGGERAAP